MPLSPEAQAEIDAARATPRPTLRAGGRGRVRSRAVARGRARYPFIDLYNF